HLTNDRHRLIVSSSPSGPLLLFVFLTVRWSSQPLIGDRRLSTTTSHEYTYNRDAHHYGPIAHYDVISPLANHHNPPSASPIEHRPLTIDPSTLRVFPSLERPSARKRCVHLEPRVSRRPSK
ncbi:unnamed protein product, partial [Dovyalis caffra]